MQQNVELQNEIETFRSKLEDVYIFVNEKINQQKFTTSASLIQIAFEQMQQTEMKLLEFKLKLVSQQVENDLLKYLVSRLK